ncbi:nucleoside hydrolase [Caldisericum exile]|uniref:Ribonucleoside hydrolase n=1 Tax=Caldisericum exile (strain DSM 21853 / NBRC 104410 / AZM16c01) TaxID=511051 RepID=A0A7U6GFM7_CALEA|nr:nucleoside hydrolase [Caldisericum exile]BAL81538.1 ribonucleoside hydrolase [Caldisericum exile AZM16c01]
MNYKMIIDTDCGIDDAVTIMSAIKYGIDIVGITTVSGNVYVDQVTDNVLRILNFMGRNDIKVFKGAHKPLISEKTTPAKIHGENGLGNVELEKSEKIAEEIPAPFAIYKLAKENPGIILLTLGPLTNIAMAFNLYPELKNYVSKIVSMGGAVNVGNVTRFAEFNFFYDPEAAEFVLRLGIPIHLVPWDPVVSTPIFEDELKETFKGKEGALILQMEKAVMDFVEKSRGVRGVFLPDPMALVTFLSPNIIKSKINTSMHMELSHGSLMRGASFIGEGHGTEIIMEVDKRNFLDFFKNIF